ncbi:MAG: glutamate--tRNA ligase [Actinomycetota bacterium]
MSVRSRFAPAPSGELHVGGARTALFSWLFARHTDGAFVLRIEDTDRDRVTPEAIEGVQEALAWLGIDWDEGPGVGGDYGPYIQSERMETYRAAADRLQGSGRAYLCYCTPEELEERRKRAIKRGQPPGYDGRCRNLSDEERATFEAEGRPAALRFATPGTDVTVRDLIRGEAHFPASDLKDFVILRSDGTPTYLLAAAVDDHAMKMSHVIRGEDLFSSTPRQMLILEALGASPPEYAHLPLIVGPDRQPLSKRHGSVSVEWFRDQGFLPEAMINYLALLGWSLDEHTTFVTRDGLVEHFDLTRVSHNPAAFDIEKLEWMNGHYVREMPVEELAERLVPFFERAGVEADLELLREAVPLVNERIKLLSEAVEMLRFLFEEEIVPNEKARKLLEKAGREYVASVVAALEALDDWTAESIHRALDTAAEAAGLSRTKGWQPVRAAVTGSNISPPLPESLELLGRERTLARLRAAASS